MKYIDLYDKYVHMLEDNGFKDARSDVLFMIYEIFGCDFSKWSIHKYDKVEDISKVDLLGYNIAKRLTNMPVQYILNKAYFCGLPFYVDENVLIPRFDTEVLVEEIINLTKENKNMKILDMCTGSGAIAIALKRLGNFETVDALDISDKAIEVAKKNANDLDCDINIFKSDMFSSLTSKNKYDIIVSNPPYIKSRAVDTLDKEVKDFEPRLALDGDIDGMKFYAIIEENFVKYLKPGGILVLEIGYDQAEDIKKLFKNYNTVVKKDLSNLNRSVIIYT